MKNKTLFTRLNSVRDELTSSADANDDAPESSMLLSQIKTRAI